MTEDRSPRPGSVRPGDDSDSEAPYTLDDLCNLAGVTVRTVRYYISEGLLPPPTGHGTLARYRQLHLDRLRAIGVLKERYLPLREIRRMLDAMMDREIATLANEAQPVKVAEDADAISPTMFSSPPTATGSHPQMSPPARAVRESSAADYIADVLDRGSHRKRPPTQPRTRHPAPEPEAPAWRRVAISPDAELLIEEDTYQRRREQIESLVAWTQRILSGT